MDGRPAVAVADPTLTRVVQSWQPRFLANGIDPNDYQRTVSGLATWDEWYAAWMRLGGEHERLAQDASRDGREITAGEAYYRAALAYHFAVFSWVHNLAEYVADEVVRLVEFPDTALRLDVGVDESYGKGAWVTRLLQE